MNRDKLITFINNYLNSDKIHDYCLNGLQVEGKTEIKKAAFSPSISIEVIKKAVDEKADIIITHHALFWKKYYRIEKNIKEKLKLLLENNINFACWHLPLDIHPVIGNNAAIIKMLGAKIKSSFGYTEGVNIGYNGVFSKPKKLNEIIATLKKINPNPLVLNYGKNKIKKISVVTGGGQKFFEEAIKSDTELYITGEASEYNFEEARENKTNFIAVGHYASEKFGILNLKKLIEKKFRIKTVFIDTKNPL